jgi:phosphoheptose isomerase
MTVLSAEHGALMSELEQLISEERNPNTMEIDLLPTAEVLRLMNREDRSIADAVGRVIAEIACAVDRIVDAFAKGGRLIYLGAGTSGRLGVLDAAECSATFSVPADMVLGLIAGGADAFSKATESAEDDAEAGVEALKDIGLIRRDVVVGITVSGRTPYVVGGLTYAKVLGATTVALSCNQDAVIARMADISILPVVGPEVVAGSTRLKWHGAEACAQHAHYRKHDPLGQVLPEPDGRSQTDQHEARRPGGAYRDAGNGLHDRAGSRGAQTDWQRRQACDPDYGYGHASQTRQIGLGKRGRLPPQGDRVAL